MMRLVPPARALFMLLLFFLHGSVPLMSNKGGGGGILLGLSARATVDTSLTHHQCHVENDNHHNCEPGHHHHHHDDNVMEYGVDVSFPMKQEHVDSDKGEPLGNRQAFYEWYIQGCMAHFGEDGSRCLENERARIKLMQEQPQSMRNYTRLGFQKIRAPESVVFQLIQDFWEANKDHHDAIPEVLPPGNTHINLWEAPTYMVSLANETLTHGGTEIQRQVYDSIQSILEEWTGQSLKESSLYGIRVYHQGAVLAPHVDTLPRVVSAIINVDQDVDEPWPLEVIGHDGKAHNVTMEPGDIVLYESHSVIHGRPFPLKGRFMANAFVHFAPMMEDGTNDLPPYLIPGSPAEDTWREHHSQKAEANQEQTDAHKAAMTGNLKELRSSVQRNPELLNSQDSNGWTPLHEAVRYGNVDAVTFLVEQGANVNARTHDGRGGSPLYLALSLSSHDGAIATLLRKHGAKRHVPDWETKF